MATVVRDLLDAQAPGVFFGDGTTGLNYTQLVKEGDLEKLGRGRGILGSMLSKKWSTRRFKVHEDFKVYYYDGSTPRGEFSIQSQGDKITRLAKEDAEGKEFAFEVISTANEKIHLNASSEEEVTAWITTLKLVASGKYKLYKFTDLLAKHVGWTLPPNEHIDVEIEEETLKAVMATDGYGPDRMMEIVEEYLNSLNTYAARYHAEDNEFGRLFQQKVFARKIFIVKCSETSTSKGCYRTKFNKEGGLEIQFIKAWTNVNYLGEDMVFSISEGEDIPYVVAKSLRQQKPVADSYLQSIGQLLGISDIQYDYCIKENLPKLLAGGYTADRFAEVFFRAHLQPLFEKMARFISEDQQFKVDFVEKFSGKTIIVRPAANPDKVKNSYNSSFTSDGNLLIEYRAVWTNINNLGADLVQAVSAGSDIPYLAAKSIRQGKSIVDAFMSAIEQMLGITGVTYDYCVKENLAAMQASGYGEGDRFAEIFFTEHLKHFVERLGRFMSEDSGFQDAFLASFTGRKLIIRPATNPDNIKNNYQSSFTQEGNLLIEYRSVWSNINALAADLDKIISSGSMNYKVAKSIRAYSAKMDAHLRALEALLNITGITYDYCYESNFPAMTRNSYGDDRFGEVFLDVHLNELNNRVKKFINDDDMFREVMVSKFTGKKLIIRPAANPDNVKNYYDSSFTPEGNLLIEYRSCWVNINTIGRDLTDAVSAGSDVPYIAAKSIRQGQAIADAYIRAIEQLLGITGITYDYCAKENLAAMKASGYGNGERFAEIFFTEHLKPVVERIGRFMAQDPAFKDAFVRKFTGKKIVIRPGANPDSIRDYYQSSFTPEGNLLIEYRSVWSNINALAADLDRIL